MLGTLLIMDAYKCRNLPADVQSLLRQSLEAIKTAGMRPVNTVAQNFPKEVWGHNHGDSVLTLIVPLEESHLAIHTWPEEKFVAVDLFTCGNFEKALRAIYKLKEELQPETADINCYYRGGGIKERRVRNE
jgi:S-adenosylmethionine decarboxylase proenzyme